MYYNSFIYIFKTNSLQTLNLTLKSFSSLFSLTCFSINLINSWSFYFKNLSNLLLGIRSNSAYDAKVHVNTVIRFSYKTIACNLTLTPFLRLIYPNNHENVKTPLIRFFINFDNTSKLLRKVSYKSIFFWDLFFIPNVRINRTPLNIFSYPHQRSTVTSSLRLFFLNVFFFKLRLPNLNVRFINNFLQLDYTKSRNTYKLMDSNTNFKHKSAYTLPFINLLNNIVGKSIIFKLNLNLASTLPLNLILTINLWAPRFIRFNTMFGRPLFIKEALYVVFIMFYSKDIEIFTLWLKLIFKRISFWKYRQLFSYLISLFGYISSYNFLGTNVKGIKLKFKGKVNVAGNSRKRIYTKSIGSIDKSSFETKVQYQYIQISTFTGAIGVHFWLFF